MKAISYIRVSTKKQGRSGLGLEAQRELIGRFLDAQQEGVLIEEYVDVASGSKDGRAVLKNAIAHAKKVNATLVIAKLDRMSRRVSFIAALMDSGISFKVAEMAEATAFQLHIYAALAQEERRLTSERTKAALKAAKARGIKLGTSSKVLSVQNRQRAVAFAETIRSPLFEMRNNAAFSYRSIADQLNEKGIASYTGKRWHSATVRRACRRLKIDRHLSQRIDTSGTVTGPPMKYQLEVTESYV